MSNCDKICEFKVRSLDLQLNFFKTYPKLMGLLAKTRISNPNPGRQNGPQKQENFRNSMVLTLGRLLLGLEAYVEQGNRSSQYEKTAIVHKQYFILFTLKFFNCLFFEFAKKPVYG